MNELCPIYISGLGRGANVFVSLPASYGKTKLVSENQSFSCSMEGNSSSRISLLAKFKHEAVFFSFTRAQGVRGSARVLSF